MKIVTGKRPQAHVTSDDDRNNYASIWGTDDVVLNRNEKFAYSIEASNTVRVKSGDIMIQGTHCRSPYGTYDDVVFDNGTTGYKRIDLIVIRYSINDENIETAEIVALKGTPTTGTPTPPTPTQGNILQGDDLREVVLYEVPFDGVNMGTITQKFDIVNDISTIVKMVKNSLHPVNSIYMSVDNTNPAEIFGFGEWVAWGSGRVPVGVDTTQTEFATVEKTNSANTKTHTLSVAQIPSHRHGSQHLHSLSGSGGNVRKDPGVGSWMMPGDNRAFVANNLYTTQSDHPYTEYEGSEQAHNNLQPYITCYMWKRTA